MGNWDIIGKDLIELSTAEGKDPNIWRPWTGGNWSILGMLNTLDGIISKMLAWMRIISDELKVCFTFLHIFNITMLWAMDEVMDLFVFV